MYEYIHMYVVVCKSIVDNNKWKLAKNGIRNILQFDSCIVYFMLESKCANVGMVAFVELRGIR